MNIKKMLTSLSAMVVAVSMICPTASVFGATYSEELQGAYNWAYSKGVTTMNSIDNANMYGAITRAEMAKMLSVYAVEVLGLSEDEARACNFTDIDSVKGDLHDYIIKSCKLGIMGQGITAFRPYDTLSRAEFGTALSRVLWGDKYEGGTPYYANHLNALKAAGIMNQIANAEQTKEVRGYVMLMLQRSEENDIVSSKCDDAAIKLACELDSDECPAECRNNNNEEDDEDEVVKSGSLEVSSSSADERSVVVSQSGNAVSDLDTLTFKTSEEVTLSKVVLEKYGYSNSSDLVSSVWLENEDGKEISNKAKPNQKGLVNLTIKKDYKTIDGTFNAIIVIETNSIASGAKVGGTIGFKVSDVTSTAKDVDLGDYKAYKYDVVAYDGTEAKITAKGGTKDYNYEGKAIEISKFKIKAPDDSAIEVNSFTLTNSGNLDIYDNIDAEDVEVSIDGSKVKATITINKDEELTVSLKEPLEISAKAQAEVILTATLNSDFEDYGSTIQLKFASASDLSATDKNNARITVDKDSAKWVIYEINGGQIKITNNKLGPVEASINSTDVLIADGYITVAEDIEDGVITVTCGTNGKAIEAMRLVFAGDEYDGTTKDNGNTWTFSNLEASESGKLKLYVDVYDNTGYQNLVINPTIAGWDTFKYTNASKTSKKPDISGTLTISKLTIQAPEGTLTNNLSSSDDVEFTNNETNTEVVFDGTYKADKQDINLNSFSMQIDSYTGVSKIKFYLYIDDMDSSLATLTVTSGTKINESDSFNDVLVKAGESVKVKVEAEITAKEATTPFKVGKFMLVLDGEDENDNDAGHAERRASNIVIVEKGSVSVTDSSVAKKAVLRKASSAKIAEFTVKPEGANSVSLETIEFDLAFVGTYEGNVDLYVGGSKKKLTKPSGTYNGTYKADFTTNVESDGVVVVVELDDELAGSVELTNLKVNGNAIKNNDFSKKFEEAVVWFTDQSYNDDQTTFKFGIDKKDSATIENVKISIDGGSSWININGLEAIKAGYPYLVNNVSGTIKDVTDIQFTINGGGYVAPTCSGANLKSDKSACETPVFSASTCKVNGVDVKAGAATLDSSTCTATLAATWDGSASTCKVNGVDVKAGTATLDSSTCTATLAATWTDASCSYNGVVNAAGDACEATSYDAGTAATPITYSSSDYLDMFKLNRKDDGTRVQVGRLKNS